MEHDRNGKPTNITSDVARQFLVKGLAIEPILMQGVGEMTRLILHDEQHVISCTTQRFLHQLCQTLFFDLKSLQEKVQKTIDKKQLVPIPLTFRFVMFPLRVVNKQKVKTRGFLWIAHRSIKQIIAVNPKMHLSEITLTNGHTFIVPYTSSFINQQIRDSYLVEYFFHEAHSMFSSPYSPTISGQLPKEAIHDQLLRIAEEIRNYPI